MKTRTTKQISEIKSKASFFGTVQDIEAQKKEIDNMEWVAVDDLISLAKDEYISDTDFRIMIGKLLNTCKQSKVRQIKMKDFNSKMQSKVH